MNTSVTSENCFESPEFCAWWDEIESINMTASDTGWELDLLVEMYNDKVPVKQAADKLMEEIEIGRAEAWMTIPSWNR